MVSDPIQLRYIHCIHFELTHDPRFFFWLGYMCSAFMKFHELVQDMIPGVPSLMVARIDNIAVCETAVRLHGRDGCKPAGQSVSPAHVSNVTKIEGWSGTRESFWTTLTTLNLNLLYRLRLLRNCYCWTCRTQHFVKHSWQDPDQMFKFAVHWIEDPQLPNFWARRLQARMAQQSNSIRLWQWGHLPLFEATQLLTFIYTCYIQNIEIWLYLLSKFTSYMWLLIAERHCTCLSGSNSLHGGVHLRARILKSWIPCAGERRHSWKRGLCCILLHSLFAASFGFAGLCRHLTYWYTECLPIL